MAFVGSISLILDEFDADDREILAPNVEDWWNLYAVKVAIDPTLQYWFTLRHCVDRLLRKYYASGVDSKEGDTEYKYKQKTSNLQEMRANIMQEIKRLEGQGRGRLGAVVMQPTITAPINPPSGWVPDANDPAYRGTPYRTLFPGLTETNRTC